MSRTNKDYKYIPKKESSRKEHKVPKLKPYKRNKNHNNYDKEEY